MGQFVPITSIVVDRELEPGDDVTDLAEHIRDSGLQFPILINHTGQLIDGLRRLRAVQSLGMNTIEADSKLLFPQACMHLKKTREHGVHARPLSTRRIWQIYRMLIPLMNITRAHLQRGKKKGDGLPIGAIGGRDLIIPALGLDSGSWLQALTQVYRAAEADPTVRGDLARAGVAGIEDGTMTVYMAAEHMRNPRQLKGDIRKAEEQRSALRAAASALTGIGRGLDQFGPIHPDFDRAEIEDYLHQLRTFRRQFIRFIHIVEEEINK